MTIPPELVAAARATLAAWDDYADATCDELAARLAELLDAFDGKPALHAVDELEASRHRHPSSAVEPAHLLRRGEPARKRTSTVTLRVTWDASAFDPPETWNWDDLMPGCDITVEQTGTQK